MNRGLSFTFLTILLLFIHVHLKAQDNKEPGHACFHLHQDREIPSPLMQNRVEPDRFICFFSTRKDWSGKQVFAKIPGIEFPYIFRINGFSFGSDPGSGVTTEFNITPFLREEENSMELELDLPDREAEFIDCPDCGEGTLLIRDGIHVRDLVITSYRDAGAGETLIRFHLYIKSYLTGNNSSREIQLHVEDPEGKQVCNVIRNFASPLSFGQETEMIIDETLEESMPWSPAFPQLYRLEVNLSEEEAEAGEIITTTFGIRSAVMADSAIVINGDTLAPVIAMPDLAASLPSLPEKEIRELIEEGVFNAIITRKPLPCNLVKLFDRTGVLVLIKMDQEEPAVKQSAINSPSVVWVD